MRSAAFAFFVVSCIATSVFAASETRCGWFDNPTPNNMSLVDAEASWTISVQGGIDSAFFLDDNDPKRIAEVNRQDAVQNHLPNFPWEDKAYWASRNVGSYGFGCACLTGSFDKARQVVMAVKHSKPLPLAKCYADKKLPKPE